MSIGADVAFLSRVVRLCAHGRVHFDSWLLDQLLDQRPPLCFIDAVADDEPPRRITQPEPALEPTPRPTLEVRRFDDDASQRRDRDTAVGSELGDVRTRITGNHPVARAGPPIPDPSPAPGRGTASKRAGRNVPSSTCPGLVGQAGGVRSVTTDGTSSAPTGAVAHPRASGSTGSTPGSERTADQSIRPATSGSLTRNDVGRSSARVTASRSGCSENSSRNSRYAASRSTKSGRPSPDATSTARTVATCSSVAVGWR